MLRKRGHAVLVDDRFEALEVLPDAQERRRQNVEFMMNSFAPLLPEEPQSYTKPSHAFDDMVFQQVELGRDVSQTTCYDLATSTGHEDLDIRV